MRSLSLFLSLAFLLPVHSTFAAGDDGEPSVFDRETVISFYTLESAHQRIDPDAIDSELLSAAIFFETNVRRIEHGLKPLDHLPKLREAAAMQTEIMAERNVLAHVNPERPERRTPWQRIEEVGLDPKFAAENVATHFLLDYKSGKPFYASIEGDRQVFSYQPDGDPIPYHTYLSFASSLLDQWMDSPEHRKNILDENPTHLGCAARLSRREGTMDVCYCAQEFFTAMPQPTAQ